MQSFFIVQIPGGKTRHEALTEASIHFATLLQLVP